MIFIEKGGKTLARLAYLCYTAYINLCHLVALNDNAYYKGGMKVTCVRSAFPCKEKNQKN